MQEENVTFLIKDITNFKNCEILDHCTAIQFVSNSQRVCQLTITNDHDSVLIICTKKVWRFM